MTREQFLAQLRSALRGMPDREVEEILADYGAHFDEAASAGRSAREVADALGPPEQLARELRVEAGLRRWEERRTPGNLVTAIFALAGLAAVDVIFLLPLLFVFGVAAFVGGVVLFALTVAGLATLASPLWLPPFDGVQAAGTALAGVGLVAGAVGGGALLVLAIEAVVRLLSRYARLHYQVIRPADGNASRA